MRRRFHDAAQRFTPTEGVDIDGKRFRSLLMVGSNLDGKTTQGLSPAGVLLLVSVLGDRIERFPTAEAALEFLIRSEREKGLPSGDERQTVILIDANFNGFAPQAREHAEATAIAHELGHVASRVLGVGEAFENLPAYERDQVAKELEKAFRSSRVGQGATGAQDDWERNPEEWFAEVFMVYLMDPEFAKQEAPLTCSVLRRLWNNHPILSQILRLS